MRRLPLLLVAPAAAGAAVLLPAAPALAGPALVAVEPGNGEVVTEPPGAVVMTFSADVDVADVTIDGPDAVPGEVIVTGTTVEARLSDGADGDYLVGYTVSGAGGEVSGQTAFTVDPAGPADDGGGSALDPVVTVVVGAALVAALVLTVRRFRGRT